MVRQTVAWVAGGIGMFEYEDPAKAMQEAVANDPDLDALTEALRGIRSLMGNRWFETRELLSALNACSFYSVSASAGAGAKDELRELLEDITGTNKLSSRGLGRVLGFRVDRIAGGMKLEKRSGGRVASFRVVSVEPEQVAV